MNKEIDIILSRYFSGEATEKELHNLEVWLSKSDENEKLFHQWTLLYEQTGQTDDFPAFDTEKALKQFKTYLSENQKKNQHHAELDSAPPSYNALNKEIAGHNSATLNIQARNDGKTYLFKYAAAIALLAVSTFALFHFVNYPAKTIQLMAVETIENHKLSESTNVTLFAGSEINYKKANNMVQLKGKAIFNIHSKNAEGIVVQAGDVYIKDIGTIFTVDASKPDKSITVDITEGEVLFYTKTNTGIQVKSNESAMYDAQTKQFQIIEKQSVSQKESFVDGFDFQNTPLREAIDVVKLRYKTDIILANELNEVLLNVSFDNNDPVEYILEIITETLSVRLSKKGNTYIISSK